MRRWSGWSRSPAKSRKPACSAIRLSIRSANTSSRRCAGPGGAAARNRALSYRPGQQAGRPLRSAPACPVRPRVVGQAEELDHAAGVAAHRREQPLRASSPCRRPAWAPRSRGSGSSVVSNTGIAQALRCGQRQRLRHVGRVHEAEVQRHAPEAVAQRLAPSTRSSAGTQGTSRKPTVRITLRSCSTWLCFRLCSSACGTVAGSATA